MTNIESLAYRWALHSPEFCLARTGLLGIATDPARLHAFTSDAAQMNVFKTQALERYIAHENRFYSDSGVATEIATIGEAAHLHIIELASAEHASAGLALMQGKPLKLGKARSVSDFYNTFDARLRNTLLPRSRLAVAYCNQRRCDLACVKSFAAWNDRFFYETSVLTLVRMRASMKLDLPKVYVTVNPVPVTLTTNRSVTKTVITERLPDGKMLSTVVEE